MILKGEYQVLLAKNAEEAFRQIHAQIPDVVLLDLILPDMDGLRVLEKIKQTVSKIVEAISGKSHAA